MSTRVLISLTCSAALAVVAVGYAAAPTPTPKADTAPVAFDKAPAVGTMATCAVCKGEFKVTAKTTRSEYKGKHYVFCCPDCKAQFDKDPEKHVGGAKAGSHQHGAPTK